MLSKGEDDFDNGGGVIGMLLFGKDPAFSVAVVRLGTFPECSEGIMEGAERDDFETSCLG
jgi:hypothetical protein